MKAKIIQTGEEIEVNIYLLMSPLINYNYINTNCIFIDKNGRKFNEKDLEFIGGEEYKTNIISFMKNK